MTNSNYELRIFEDKFESVSVALPPVLRVLYVVSGGVEVDGNQLATGEGVLVQNHCEISGSEPTTLARWELAEIGAPLDNPFSRIGDSLLKRSDNIILKSGDEVGIRLDTVTFPPGTRAYRHIHASPGIRYLLRGSLEINRDEGRDLIEPGRAWFEGVNEPVLAIADDVVETQFVRVMILPPDYHGKLTITYVDPADDDKPRENKNERLIDEVVRLDG